MRCRLLFATHYHPLTADFGGHPLIWMGHMMAIVHGAEDVGFDRETLEGASPEASPCFPQVDNEDDEAHITFLYRLREGACPRSYGLQVGLQEKRERDCVRHSLSLSHSLSLLFSSLPPELPTLDVSAVCLIELAVAWTRPRRHTTHMFARTHPCTCVHRFTHMRVRVHAHVRAGAGYKGERK